jgi:hypothetical protein
MGKYGYFKNKLRTALASLMVIAVTVALTSCEKSNPEEPSPLSNIKDVKEHGAVIPGRYIVVFKNNVDFGLEGLNSYGRSQARMRQAGKEILRRKGIPEDRLTHVYANAIKGIAVKLTKAELAQLKGDSQVAYIEEDRIIVLAPPAGKGPNKDEGGTTQDVPWGIQRVGGPGNGAGKTAWVLDTGIDMHHPELNADAERSISMFYLEPEATPDDLTPQDMHGHGTHVAGTLAAKNNNEGVVGVAADAIVVAVKVLDYRGRGTYATVIGGVDYVAANGQAGDVANMSLGGPVSQALDDAVLVASEKVKFAIAAGNSGADASNQSPARVNGPNIYTVAAIDSRDLFTYWSNWGQPPVDYAAPGEYIMSLWINGEQRILSGTSMAAPHVAGLLLIGEIGVNCYATGDPDNNLYPIAYRGDKRCNLKSRK